LLWCVAKRTLHYRRAFDMTNAPIVFFSGQPASRQLASG
jgi:hypothetical protein